MVNPKSWTKSREPVFVSNSKTNQWGPGHNSFTVSEDGLSDIFVYHNRGYRDIKGDPLDDPNRRTRVQKLYWKADGSPDFGIPIADGMTPIRLRSYKNPDLVMRQKGTVRMEANPPSLAETQFRMMNPGLAGAGTVSLESGSDPGSFLRRTGTGLGVAAKQATAAFSSDASFKQVPGLANSTGVSFEASGAPGQYILMDETNNLLVSAVSAGAQQEQATFVME